MRVFLAASFATALAGAIAIAYVVSNTTLPLGKLAAVFGLGS